MLHVLQGRRASGGVGWVGGVWEVITSVGTFTHIPCYMFCRDAGHLVGWVGWGGVGEVITFVGTFTHIPYYIFARVRRTFLCRFEPDQKRMSSDTLGSRLSTCHCHKRSACWPCFAFLQHFSGSWHLWASCFQQSELASFGPRDENMSQSDGSRNHKLNIAAFEGPCPVWSCLTSNTNTVCCCCCCCCYIDMSAKITLVATTWHSDFAH